MITSRLKKFALIALGSAVAVVILAYVALSLFFPAEQMREYLQEVASEKLGQPVTVGSLGVSFWGGIGATLEDVSVGANASLASVSSVAIKVKFWPLLQGEYQISRLEFNEPIINLIIQPDGSTNLTPPQAPVDSSNPEQPSSSPSPSSASPLSGSEVPAEALTLLGGLSFGDLRVSDGTLHRTDSVSGARLSVWGINYQGSLTESAEGLLQVVGELATDSALTQELRVPDFKLTYQASVEIAERALTVSQFALRILDIELQVTGDVSSLNDQPALALEYELLADDLPATFLRLAEIDPAYDLSHDLKLEKGELNLSGEISYWGEHGLRITGAGALGDLLALLPGDDMNGADMNDNMSAAPRLSVDKALISFDANSASLDIPALEINGQSLALTCTLENFDNPLMRVAVKGEIELGSFANMLTKYGQPELSGSLLADLSMTVPLNKLEELSPNGTIRITDCALRAQALLEPIENLSLSLKISPELLKIEKLTMSFPSSDLTMTGEISQPFPYLLPISDSLKELSDNPYLSFELTSRRLDIDRLFPEAAPGSGVNRVAQASDSLTPIIPPLMKGAGVVRIDTLIYAQMEMTEVVSSVRIEKRLIICDPVEGRVYDGPFSASATIDLTSFERPAYYGKFSGDSLQVDGFVSRFSPWGGAGYLLGRVKLAGDFSGSGWEPEDFLQSVSMNCDISGDKMQLNNAPLMKNLGQQISSLTGQNQNQSSFGKLDLNSFASRFRFVDGKLMVDDLAGLVPGLGKWALSGAVALDGSLQLRGDFFPAEELVSSLLNKSSLGGAVSDFLGKLGKQGIILPLTISGTIDKPQIKLDLAPLDAAVKNTLQEKGSDLIKGLFKKR